MSNSSIKNIGKGNNSISNSSIKNNGYDHISNRRQTFADQDFEPAYCVRPYGMPSPFPAALANP